MDHGKAPFVRLWWLRSQPLTEVAREPGQHPSTPGTTRVFVPLRIGDVPDVPVVRAGVRSPHEWPRSVASRRRRDDLLAGCSLGGPERVGGEPDADVHELTMLHLFDPQEVTQFTDEVSRLSEGELRIRMIHAEQDGVDYETATVRRLQDGEADLAVVGTRAWDDLGAPGLAALGAPFLVDSYPLQERIFTSGLVETILQELRPAGMVGIGILPGPIRRPFGLTSALVAPRDFQGLTIGTQQSNVADATLMALGAQPRRLPIDVSAPDGLSGVDGVELQVAAVETGRLDAEGSHLMTNVNLWPRSLVVFAGAAAYGRLSDDERRILHTAATNVVAEQAAANRGLEEEAAANLCRKGNTIFDVATTEQLQTLHRAVEPVYAELERDQGARKVIEAIEQLKKRAGRAPDRDRRLHTGARRAQQRRSNRDRRCLDDGDRPQRRRP